MLPINPYDLHVGVICNIALETGDSYSKEMAYVEYTQITEHLLNLIEKDKEEAYFLVVPFIFTICASLEAILNDFMIIHCFNTHGPEEYKAIAESYIGISFAKKLRIIVAILSDNSFQLREDSATVRELDRLIAIRNKLTHAHSYFVKDKPLSTRKSKKFDSFQSSIPIPSVKDCRTFFQAFTEFDQKFIQQYDNNIISENDLIHASEALKQEVKAAKEAETHGDK